MKLVTGQELEQAAKRLKPHDAETGAKRHCRVRPLSRTRFEVLSDSGRTYEVSFSYDGNAIYAECFGCESNRNHKGICRHVASAYLLARAARRMRNATVQRNNVIEFNRAA